MVASNNAINNTVGASITGVTNTLTITNPSNTASSAARTSISVGGGTAADPTLNFNVSGVTNWEMGIDNNDSDNLKISQGTALGTNDTWVMTTAGERTMPLQPAFAAQITVTQSNVTGDSTAAEAEYTTVLYDVNSDYDGTSRFTAPVTGKYIFFAALDLTGFTAAYTNHSVSLITSNHVYRLGPLLAPGKVYTSGTQFGSGGGGTVADMDAADIAYVQAFAAGGTKTISFFGGTFVNCFSGCLIC